MSFNCILFCRRRFKTFYNSRCRSVVVLHHCEHFAFSGSDQKQLSEIAYVLACDIYPDVYYHSSSTYTIRNTYKRLYKSRQQGYIAVNIDWNNLR